MDMLNEIDCKRKRKTLFVLMQFVCFESAICYGVWRGRMWIFIQRELGPTLWVLRTCRYYIEANAGKASTKKMLWK